MIWLAPTLSLLAAGRQPVPGATLGRQLEGATRERASVGQIMARLGRARNRGSWPRVRMSEWDELVLNLAGRSSVFS